jgi:hypothetical protein
LTSTDCGEGSAAAVDTNPTSTPTSPKVGALAAR